MPQTLRDKSAFTLIELSIVLVIIGLIVGGILVGQDLINAATVRSQISQIEKYNVAVHTFQGKYGYLPGDIPDPYATQFGFKTRGTSFGQGDGDGFIAGAVGHGSGWTQTGEPLVFWVDLSTAGLIDGGFSIADPVNYPNSSVTGSGIAAYLPAAKLGNSLYVYTLSAYAPSGVKPSANLIWASHNFFSISPVTTIKGQSDGPTWAAGEIWGNNSGISVMQAYNIDKKIDDGLPFSGKVMPVSSGPSYGDPILAGISDNGCGNCLTNTSSFPSGAMPASSTSCFDNNGSASNPITYSVTNGNRTNCTLSFQFQ